MEGYRALRRWHLARKTVTWLGALLVAFAFTQNLELLVTQWCDARREVEAFLRTLPAGTRVETYGLGVYLPRFDLGQDSNYEVTRTRGLDSRRAPLIAGLRERKANYADVDRRRPDVLALPAAALLKGS